MWDKNFPKILPPPKHEPEKENKEVDVELDMLMMPDMMGDGGTPKARPDNPRSDMLDPNGLLFDDRTQGSLEKVKSKEFVIAMKKSAEMATQKSAEKSRQGVNLKRSTTTKSGNEQSKAEFGENDLSDWTDEEFRKMLLPKSFYKKLREEATFIQSNPPKLERAAPPPDFFDWRARNVVSPVKAQGKCGSCWAFAATATVEAAWAIAHGEMRNLSEQTLLDCDLQDNACDGGDEDKAFRYIHRNGLAFAADLPYVAHRQNTCDVNGNTTKIQVAYFIHPDEQSMIDWLVGFGPEIINWKNRN
ncbi:hypothetical protein GCK32_007239, partial [Trichostrongylus colubriformis]